jgi:hypothetical protein
LEYFQPKKVSSGGSEDLAKITKDLGLGIFSFNNCPLKALSLNLGQVGHNNPKP